MGITFKLDGVDSTLKSFRDYEADKIKRLGKLVEVVSFGIEKDAKLVVPVDTGRLRSSIKVRPLGFALKKNISANTDYAADVEFFNRAYLRPAFQRGKGELKRGLVRVFRK